MFDPGFFAVFLIGLLGGTHCVGMCGGIVSALSVSRTIVLPGQRPGPDWTLQLAYNGGRITGYTLAGAVAGAIGGMGLMLENIMPVQMGLYILANLMLIGLGLYLTGLTQALGWIEAIGQKLWRRIQPLTTRYLPARSPAQAFPLGLLWGFLPCGLVYSVLAMALVSGSVWRGAGMMLLFGLGTLPNLLLAGMLLQRARDFTRKRAVRVAAGLLVLGFGVFGLLNATTLGGRLWEGVVCHTA